MNAKSHDEQNNTIFKKARTRELELIKRYKRLMVTHSGEVVANRSSESRMSEERKSENVFQERFSVKVWREKCKKRGWVGG